MADQGKDIDAAAFRQHRSAARKPASGRLVLGVSRSPPQALPPRHPQDGDQPILQLDQPVLSGGAVLEAVTGPLTIGGWALARDGIASVDVFADGRSLATAIYGLERADVARRYPDRPEAVRCGFSLTLPSRILTNGRHEIALEAVGKGGLRAQTKFFLDVSQTPIDPAPGSLRLKLPLSEIRLGEAVLAGLGWQPVFGLLLGIGEIEAEIDAARQTLLSLRHQAYGLWRVAIVRRGRTVPDGVALRLLHGFEDLADRIAVNLEMPDTGFLSDLVRSDDRAAADADLFGVLLAGDRLGGDALLELAIASGMHSKAEFFYSDERRESPATGRVEAFFKPDWSPDLLTSTNYIGRFWCARRGVVDRAAIGAADWLRFGDYDLALRCTEAANGVWHVPKVLCERGRAQLDHPDQERVALHRAVKRRGIGGTIDDGALMGHYRLKREIDRRRLVSIIIPTRGSRGLVSIVIPTCGSRGLVRTCIETLRDKTAYRDFEIICVENIPASEPGLKAWLRTHADRVVSVHSPFNWSLFNNLGARRAAGEFLLFLNDDVEIIDADWLDALVEHAQRPEVGAVGARLLYPDRKIQHAGIFWTPGGGRHSFRGLPAAEPGYFGLAVSERNVLALTGACLMTRRTEFEAQGGFDEAHAVVNNDVDYCLRAWERDKRVVYTPHATLMHHELASRAGLDDTFDKSGFDRRWGRRLRAGDPYYHPHLARDREDYASDPEPLELVHPRHPLFDGGELRDILVMKLDHIGDFITAIPALRRLQTAFPQARLHLLTSPANRAIVGLVPGVADVIEFSFYHARTDQGPRPLTNDDLTALRRRLEPYHFDLAIDLRKWPETRPLLLYSGARWFAGFDHDGQYPWLDIVAEWEQDPPHVRKRTHISEDMLRLAEAIAAAGAPSLASRGRLGLPTQAEAAAERKSIIVHPGVGSVTRQWPPAHFVELIGLLTASHDLDIVLIGSPDEAPLADEILAKLPRAGMARSLAGKIDLADLPHLLATAVLFVGNNSGPHHLAAGLGIPTVGIHSGAVDAREWGPMGPRSVAVRRNMSCSPCYFWDPAQCGRDLACLTELRPAEVYEICARFLAINARH